jgi:hypothetical protein
LATTLRESINPFTPMLVVRCLAKNGFGFNYKELRAIEESIRSSKSNWLEVFLLLEDQILPELRKEVLNHILHNQKNYFPTTLEANNHLIHHYLQKKYLQIYSNSHFASLKQEKSYQEKPVYSALIS